MGILIKPAGKPCWKPSIMLVDPTEATKATSGKEATEYLFSCVGRARLKPEAK